MCYILNFFSSVLSDSDHILVLHNSAEMIIFLGKIGVIICAMVRRVCIQSAVLSCD